jgi:glycosyltransferase involved in cell wall biosynthesis
MRQAALVITRAWSDEPEQAVHGIFQRFSLFLDALSTQVESIEVLVFAPDSTNLTDLGDRHAAHYQHGRTARITVTPVLRAPNPVHWSAWERYAKGALSADRQEKYLNIAGTVCVEAVRRGLSSRPTLVFAHRLPVFTPLLPVLGADSPPIIFDMDDIEHRALARGLIQAPRWPSDRLRMLHVPSLMLRARKAVRASARTFVCSQADADYLSRLSGRDTVTAVPNSVNAPAVLPPKPVGGQTLGFIGSFQHPPNIDAAHWLLEDIWPRIRQKAPMALLRIAGAGSRAALARHRDVPGVEILDFVDRVDDFYQGVALMLAPLRFGAGTRVKIIEAAGYGVPTVSTTLGAEGLELCAGRDIVIADAADDIADQAVHLLRTPSAALAMQRYARSCFELHYSRDKAVAKISNDIKRAMNPGRTH